METLAHVFIALRRDYCIVLLAGFPGWLKKMKAEAKCHNPLPFAEQLKAIGFMDEFLQHKQLSV